MSYLSIWPRACAAESIIGFERAEAERAREAMAAREPAAPWVAMRYDGAGNDLPAWIDAWVKHVGVALLQREGW